MNLLVVGIVASTGLLGLALLLVGAITGSPEYLMPMSRDREQMLRALERSSRLVIAGMILSLASGLILLILITAPR